MSWSPINVDNQGKRYQHWSGPPLVLDEVIKHLSKVAAGINPMTGVYITSPTTLSWGETPAETAAREKELLKILKAKYPEV